MTRDIEACGRKTLYLCALEPEDHEETLALLRDAWPGETVAVRLELQRLRRFDVAQMPARSGTCVVLLCHCFDGRTLLTDADGLYNTFLAAAAAATGGNVFVALTGLQGEPVGAALAREDAVQQLVKEGQTSIRRLHEQRRFFTWDRVAENSHVDHVVLGALPPLDLPPTLKAHAEKALGKSKTTSFLRCTLL